jgi:hypothetical protein
VLIEKNIAVISDAFNQIGWNKPPSLFEEYLKEQEAGERLVWVAYFKGEFAGYITLKWQSLYPSFKVGVSHFGDLTSSHNHFDAI